MEIETEIHKTGNVLVNLKGRVDADTSPRLKEKFEELASEAIQVVVDLHNVDFIDSSGLSALVTGHKALTGRGGALSLSRPQPQAITALRLTLLNRVFPIYESVEDAMSQENPVRL